MSNSRQSFEILRVCQRGAQVVTILYLLLSVSYVSLAYRHSEPLYLLHAAAYGSMTALLFNKALRAGNTFPLFRFCAQGLRVMIMMHLLLSAAYVAVAYACSAPLYLLQAFAYAVITSLLVSKAWRIGPTLRLRHLCRRGLLGLILSHALLSVNYGALAYVDGELVYLVHAVAYTVITILLCDKLLRTRRSYRQNSPARSFAAATS